MTFDVNVEFDRIHDLYDPMVATVRFDLPFWVEVARAAPPPRLELMCGTGRITLAILEAGLDVEGLDYSPRLLDVFRRKAAATGSSPTLHLADARSFEISRRYGLIFIGFHSLAEVLEDADKLRVLRTAKQHLAPEGELWLSLHNPAARREGLDGRTIELGVVPVPETGEEAHITGRYQLDPATGIATGVQTYRCRRDGRETRVVELPLRFHLLEPTRLVELVEAAGMTPNARYGDYERAPFEPDGSPFFLLRAHPG